MPLCGYCGAAGAKHKHKQRDGSFCNLEHALAKQRALTKSLRSRPKGWNKPKMVLGVKLPAANYKWDTDTKAFHPPDLNANYKVESGCHIACAACFKVMKGGDDMWAHIGNTNATDGTSGWTRASCSFDCRKYYVHMHTKYGMDGEWCFEMDTGIGTSRAINSLVSFTLMAYRKHGTSYVNQLYDRTRNSVRVRQGARKGKKLFNKIGRI
jgi:hypothetical protein